MGRVMRNFAGYAVIGFIGLIVAGIALLGLGGVLYMVFSIWYAVFFLLWIAFKSVKLR